MTGIKVPKKITLIPVPRPTKIPILNEIFFLK